MRERATVVHGRVITVAILSLVLALAAPAAAQTIAFVQGNYAVPQTPQATVAVTYSAAQTAGNLNVVLVGWNDSTATVTSVTDSRGNAYSLAVGPTVLAGQASQSIYYARNIAAAAAGANAVTVSFSAAAVYPDIRVLEYRGLDTTAPLVGSAAATGTSATSNSGSLTTTVPNVLLVAGNVVQTTTSGAGASFTSRIITSPDGDIAEDRIVAAAGTYNATAPLGSGYWVMQLVAFKAPSSDTTPPTVTLTAPSAGATVSGSVTVTATASDNVAVAGVQFKLDGANLGAEVTGASPYSLTWNTTGATNGSHTLTAVARDTANLTTTSAPVSVTVSNDTTPPTVTLTVPASGATVNGSVTVTATAGDNVAVAGVQFKLDGANLGTEVTGTSPYSLTWNTTLSVNGPHTLTAVARDTSNLTTTSAAVAVTVNNPDAIPPTVALTVPASGATVSGSVTVTATASDNVAVAGVQFKLDGADLGTEVTGTSPYSLTWNTTGATNGSHTLTAVARDTANLTTTSAPVAVTVSNDTTPPTVTLTVPASGATVSGSVTVTATASDNAAVAGVQFKLDGANLGLEVTGTSPYSLTWNTTGATNGSHTLTAVARDTANLTTTSAPVAVTVSNDVTPPTVTLTVPASGATVSGSVTVTATAADNVAMAGVQFKLDGANLGTEVTGASPYSLTWNTTSAANGAHTLTAVARDTSNLTTTSAGVPVTVSNAGGTATIQFVQGSYAVPQSPQTTVAVAFPAAQSAGNLNVIAVGWNDSTATVTSVTDSRGNAYALAAAPTVMAGKASHAMYYARNIVSAGAGANVVTVRFNVAAAFADVRVLEYTGIDTVNPLLGGVGASGTSASSNSGSLTFAVANALLVGANVVQTSTSGAGTSFTNRMITSPNGDIAEDRIVAAAGTYSATAPLASGYWVMQLAAFAAGSVGPPPPDTTPPTVAITAPTAGATVSGSVTVTATASDNVAVAGVQFKLDGTNLGTEVTGASPYSLTWNTAGVTAGPHTLTAVARDTSSLTTTSAPVAVTVSNDTTPPTVTLTAPTSGAVLSGSVTLTATASDNVAVAGVQFRLDGANLGAEVTGTSPYSLTWNTTGAANGSHTLTAVARDTSNLTTTSTGVPVTVSNSGGGSGNIHFVQGNYAVPPSPQSTVAVTFLAAQSAGNLNVIVVGWADSTASVTSVTDSRSNAYALAVGPVVLTGSASQSIYYARSIVAAGAGANVITVRFTGSAAFPDIRILEYAGLDVVAPLVATTAASGTSTLSSSGSLTTSTPNVLLVAANVVQTATSGPGANFTSRMITTPNGDIVEDRIVSAAGTYSATAPLANGAWVMQMVAFGTSGGVADTTPPVVAITAPAAGASVARTVTLAANASDNVGVAGVQFKVDGTNVGAEVTAAPYYVAWNSATVADGTHVVTAVARDQANSTTSSPVSVTVSNATATATSRIGQWSGSSSWPLVAVHAALMPNGQVLAWDAAAQQGAARVWNPSTNVFTTANPPDNIFCAGFSPLADGRVFVAGGHIANYIGIPDANIFDPVSRVWSSAPSMAVGRWYPTATLLPDQRVLVVSGAIDCEECIATTPEIYNPATNAWTSLPSASLELPIYPHLFVLPNGRVLATSAFEGPSAAVELDLATGTWSVVDPVVTDGHSAAMYRLGKVVKSGTSANSDAPFINSQPTTYVLDMTQPVPAWRQTPPMAFPRAYHNLTLLPDGSVLVTGGNKVTDTFNEAQAVLAAELWSPATETWTTLASMTIPRLYHSLALLLPDGRVLVTGGGRFGNPTGDSHDKLNAQIYSPAYLFKGARPVITSVASDIPYGFTFSVATPDAARIASVVLIKLGSVTHGFNQAQRYVPLSFTQAGGALNVQAPTSAADALPGHYMLFIVDTNGVPSVAPIVRIE